MKHSILAPEVDQRFGRLVVVVPEVRLITRYRPGGIRAALCKCDCGTEMTVSLYNLLGTKKVSSCGCLSREVSPENVVRIGQRFGRLVVVDPDVRKAIPSYPKGNHAALCRCDCGNEIVVRHSSLRDGTQSCGCLRAERLRAELSGGARNRGTEIGYGQAHQRAGEVLPQECATPDGTCKGRLQVALRHDAPAEFVRRYDGPNEKFLGLLYYAGPNPADGYMRLCNSHHARYDAPKLTERRVVLIRKLVALGVLPEALAAGAGVTKKYLNGVLRRDRWADVPDE